MPTHISGFRALDMSFPFSPAARKALPSHLTMLYVAENAIPLKAIEAMRGSPSPWKVFNKIPKHEDARKKRLTASVLLNV